MLERLFTIDKTYKTSKGGGSKSRTENEYDISVSNNAVKEFCEIESDFSALVLNLVKNRQPVKRTVWREEITDDWVDWKNKKIRFDEQKRMARAELEKRDNPMPRFEDLKPEDFILNKS